MLDARLDRKIQSQRASSSSSICRCLLVSFSRRYSRDSKARLEVECIVEAMIKLRASVWYRLTVGLVLNSDCIVWDDLYLIYYCLASILV